MKPFMIIERYHHEEHDGKPTGFENITKHRKHEKHITNVIESADGYSKYVEKHGLHFTDELAEHVSKMLVNANGMHHSWTANQIKKSMESLGLSIPNNVTVGDITYSANMYYSDFYPDSIKDEASCIKAAYAIANDPDGYEGIIFCRWTTDAINKAINIDWENFI